MAKDSDKRRGGFDAEETGGALSGLLAEEDDFDRRTLWRLGTWAIVSVGAVVAALVVNQSSIGLRREQTASADLIKQAQLLQLTAKESQSENRRLASAVDTLNSDRDRLYSRVAVLEQGLDSVTGAIARPDSPPSSPQASAGLAKSGQANAGAPALASPTTAPAASPSPAPAAALAPAAAVAPAPTPSVPVVAASIDPPAAPAKPAPAAPIVAAVTAPAPAAISEKAAADKAAADKREKQASTTLPSEPAPPAKLPIAQPGASTQAAGTLIASKSMMDPPDPAAGKLIESTLPSRPASPPKTVTSEPIPDIAVVAPKEKPEGAEPESHAPAPELVARHTEFGVDVGGANSVPGLRALWRGLLKSHANAALTSLRPVIVIKESTNGLGMQLRLVAGPINDAAAAAKICASLTISERGCATAVFEGQRLSMGADEQRADTRISSEAKPTAAKPVSDAKPDSDSKPGSKYSGHRRYISRHAVPKEEDPPKPEPSTLSRIFGRS